MNFLPNVHRCRNFGQSDEGNLPTIANDGDPPAKVTATSCATCRHADAMGSLGMVWRDLPFGSHTQHTKLYPTGTA
jgi:hypothetical protein